MSDQSTPIGTRAVFVPAPDDLDTTIRNLGPGTVYYGNTDRVSASSNDGSISSGSAAAAGGRWFVSASSSLLVVATEALSESGRRPAAPQGTVYFGNATPTEYTGEPNIPLQVKTYHGNAGGYDVDGRPQGIQIAAKYFAATTEDSAQCGSGIAILVDTGTPITQTEPLLGWEGGAVVQGGNDVARAIGLDGSVDVQDTAHADLAVGVYVPEKAASEAGASIDFWSGVYVENPLATGTVTDNAGVYSKPRIQTESTLVVGTTQANTTAAVKGTTVHIVGNNTSGNPAFHVVKKSGSTDDIAQFSSSGAQPQVRVNQGGQLAIHAAGGAVSYGSSAGAMLAIGNITTPPSANYSGGSGGFLYVESGALKFRGGGGLVTTIAASA